MATKRKVIAEFKAWTLIGKDMSKMRAEDLYPTRQMARAALTEWRFAEQYFGPQQHLRVGCVTVQVFEEGK